MTNLIKMFRDEFGNTKKSLGQHFLTNPHYVQAIVNAAIMEQDEPALEIGPGCGILTDALQSKTKNITVVELDDNAVKFLNDNIAIFPNLKIIHNNFLNINLAEVYDGKFVIAGNLPYNVSVAILEHCTKNIKSIKRAVFMFQKEVANRINATNNSKDYSSLSIFCQYHYKIEKITDIGGGNFWPVANVNSTVLKFTPKEVRLLNKDDEESFFTFVQSAFKQKRKTLRNNISGIVKDFDNLMAKVDMPLNIRAEQLSLEDFIKIYETNKR